MSCIRFNTTWTETPTRELMLLIIAALPHVVNHMHVLRDYNWNANRVCFSDENPLCANLTESVWTLRRSWGPGVVVDSVLAFHAKNPGSSPADSPGKEQSDSVETLPKGLELATPYIPGS